MTTSETLRAKLARKVARYRDARVYTRAEWAARNEPIGNGSVLTLVAEGELNHILNGYRPGLARDVKLADLNAFAERHGLFVEQGYGWSWHFYP
jgi:hypothetical protein